MTGTEAKNRFSGCYAATLTPFDENDQVNTATVRRHTDWLIENGIAGLCPAGTTSEFLYLSQEEKIRVVAETAEAASGRIPVLAGVWAWQMEERAALAQAAQKTGADGVFLPPPIYYPADEDAIFAWYATVRELCDLPVFAYNIPQYAANAISLDCLERLFAEDVIAGVKDSTGKTERVQALIEQFGSRGVVFAASDGFVTTGRELGADGFISAIANAAPALVSAVWNGDQTRQADIDRLRAALKAVGSIAGLKALLSAQGFAFGASRLPFAGQLSAEAQALLWAQAQIPAAEADA
jgi:4-hydroxy-tetrahydrodipicolinate synthase